jgi:hypothetical protein
MVCAPLSLVFFRMRGTWFYANASSSERSCQFSFDLAYDELLYCVLFLVAEIMRLFNLSLRRCDGSTSVGPASEAPNVINQKTEVAQGTVYTFKYIIEAIRRD